MDPVTIAGIVEGSISLAVQCGSVVKSLNNIAGQYRYAKLTITTMIQNLDIMQLAWDRIGAWFKDYMLTDDDGFIQRLERFLEAGSLVLDALEEDLQSYHASNMTFAQRSRLVLNENTFQGHQNRIRDQAQTMGLLLQAIQLPTPQATSDLIQQPKKQFMKSDESAFSIVPSRLSSRLSISTGQTSRPNSASGHMNMTYHQLSFEDDLFTARVYKRNYRNARLQRLERREFDPDHKDVSKTSDSDNDTINPEGSRRQNNVSFVKKLARRSRGERSTTDSSAKIANEIAEDVGQQLAHGIMANPRIDVGASTIKKHGLHDRPVFKSGGDLYADFVEACRRGDNDSVQRLLAKTQSIPHLLKSYTSSSLHFYPVYATVSKGHVEVMQTLLRAAELANILGQVVEVQVGFDHCRPLHIAIMEGNLPMVELLLEKGASPHRQTDLGLQATHLAAKVGSLEILRSLVHAGAETNCEDIYGKKPQDYASEPDIKQYLRWRDIEENFDDDVDDATWATDEEDAEGFNTQESSDDDGQPDQDLDDLYFTDGTK